jgi:pullulanase/glycogen debranching enzyme
MARKVVSRKAKAAEAEAAEKLIKAKKAAKKTSKRKKKNAADMRLRLYWGVFSQNLKRVAVYEFDQKKDAEKRATELSKGGKAPHFVQKVKEEIKPE